MKIIRGMDYLEECTYQEYAYSMSRGLQDHLIRLGFPPVEAPFELRPEWSKVPIVKAISEYLANQD